VLDQLAAERGFAAGLCAAAAGLAARATDDPTWDKSDPKDAVAIARLAAGQLRCHEPERADTTCARLRHLGARRARLVTDATAGVQQLRDLSSISPRGPRWRYN
jgi:hypothetical protein